MKFCIALPVCMLSLSSALLLCAAPAKPDIKAGKKVTHQLPTDPKATVISLNYRGGFGPPRIDDSPTLSILADGTVVMPATHENRPALKEKISQAQLQELLKFMIDEQKIFQVTQESIAKQIQKERDAMAAQAGGLVAIARIADAATVEIYVQADGKEHEVSHYPSGMNESKIDHLVRFNAVRQHLQKFMSMTQLGGEQAVAKWLSQINQELKAQFPKVKPFTMDDFQSGGKSADGRIYVSFNRSTRNEDNHITKYTNGQINKPAGGEAKVSVQHRDNIPARKNQRIVPGGKLNLKIRKANPKKLPIKPGPEKPGKVL